MNFELLLSNCSILISPHITEKLPQTNFLHAPLILLSNLYLNQAKQTKVNHVTTQSSREMDSQLQDHALAPQANSLVSPVTNNDTVVDLQYSPGREPVYTVLGGQETHLQTMSHDSSLALNQPNTNLATLQRPADQPAQYQHQQSGHPHGYQTNISQEQPSQLFDFSNVPPWVHALF